MSMTAESIYWVVADDSPDNAGVRIRIRPTVDALKQHGLDVKVITQAELLELLADEALRPRAVVQAKPGDTLSHLCLRTLQRRKVPVFIDLFDNYLAWSAALELRRGHWHWLRNLLRADRVIVSTPYLGGVIRSLGCETPLELSDPIPARPVNDARRQTMAAKWPPRKTVELLWFGLGTNPLFHAGLENLFDWQHLLAGLRDLLPRPLEPRLTICCNRVPVLDTVLYSLRREGIGARFVEWSQAANAALLAAAHVVLLPSSLSGFSVSKTHNRCSDALAHHCLVLASPSGPYRGLDSAVHFSVESLADTLLRAGAGEADVPALTEHALASLAARAEGRVDVTRLSQALASAVTRGEVAGGPQPVLVVAHSHADVATPARGLGYLTLGFSRPGARVPGLGSHDYVVSLPRPCHQGDATGLAHMRMSQAGWEAIMLAMSGSPLSGLTSAAHRPKPDEMTCESEGRAWRFLFESASRTCTLLAGPTPQLRQALDDLAWLNAGSWLPDERWFEAMVGLAVQWLKQLGHRSFELAADEGGGWHSFAEQADPALAASERRLRHLWVRFRGREADWTAETSTSEAATA